MKHLQNENLGNVQVSRNKSNRVFVHQSQIFDSIEGSTRSVKEIGNQKGRLIYLNAIKKEHSIAISHKNIDKQAIQMTNFIGVELNKKNQNKRKKLKSNVITIIDNDIDEYQNYQHHTLNQQASFNQAIYINENDNEQEQKSIQQSRMKYQGEQNKFDLMRLPLILNKNTSQLTKGQKNKQKQFLSYIHSQINSSRNQPIQCNQKSQKNKLNKSLDPKQHLTLDYSQKSFDIKANLQYQGLLFPTVNKHRGNSIPMPLQKKKKNQIQLSGISVIPAQRINNHHERTLNAEFKTNRSPQINLISSEMIHKNPISNVKKSIYQLLVRKALSSY